MWPEFLSRCAFTKVTYLYDPQMDAWEVTASISSMEDDPDDAALIVGFRSSTSVSETLLLMRALSFDEQDARLGMDTYCIVSGEGATFYGGVRRWKLSDTTLTLHLSEQAVDALGIGPLVNLNLASGFPDGLELMLQRILGSGH